MGRRKTISDAELLTSAREAFLTGGFRTSTREIARQAGISEGVIFQRFPTKEDLFFAAMLPPPMDINRLLRHPELQGCALLEAITFAMIDYFRLTMPVLLQLMSHPSFKFEEFAQRHPNSPLAELRRELTAFMAREQQSGRMRPGNAGAAAWLLWSTAQSVAFVEKLGAHGGRFEPEIVRATVSAMWEGLNPA